MRLTIQSLILQAVSCLIICQLAVFHRPSSAAETYPLKLDCGTLLEFNGKNSITKATMAHLRGNRISLSQVEREATFDDVRFPRSDRYSRTFTNEHGATFLEVFGRGVMRIIPLSSKSILEFEVLRRSHLTGDAREVGVFEADFLLPDGVHKTITSRFIEGVVNTIDVTEEYRRFHKELDTQNLFRYPMMWRFVHSHVYQDVVTAADLLQNPLSDRDFATGMRNGKYSAYMVDAVVPNGYKYSAIFFSNDGEPVENMTLKALATPNSGI